MVEVGKTYLVYGSKYVKVARITNTHIYVVWATNGSSPSRTCDRMYPLHKADKFVPYSP